MKCYVKTCENKDHQGDFVGKFCKPCYIQIKKLGKLRSEMKCTETVKSELIVNHLYYFNKLTEDLSKTNGKVVLCLVQGQGINRTPRKEYLKKVSEGVYIQADGTQFADGWKIKEIG